MVTRVQHGVSRRFVSRSGGFRRAHQAVAGRRASRRLFDADVKQSQGGETPGGCLMRTGSRRRLLEADVKQSQVRLPVTALAGRCGLRRLFDVYIQVSK